MQIDIRTVIGADNSELEFEYDTPSPEAIPDVRFGENMHISGKVCNKAGYMTVGATVKLPYSTHCARCFKEISGVFTFDFEKPIAAKGILSDEDTDDYLLIEKSSIDPDSAIREAILLDFPMIFLCKNDCRGLCAKCGADLNDGDCSCPKKEIDPRLAILGKLLDK